MATDVLNSSNIFLETVILICVDWHWTTIIEIDISIIYILHIYVIFKIKILFSSLTWYNTKHALSKKVIKKNPYYPSELSLCYWFK